MTLKGVFVFLTLRCETEVSLWGLFSWVEEAQSGGGAVRWRRRSQVEASYWKLCLILSVSLLNSSWRAEMSVTAYPCLGCTHWCVCVCVCLSETEEAGNV